MTSVKLITLIACAGVSTAIADPPTPPPKPERWDFIGTYHVGEGAGRDSVTAVIAPESIRRDGDIVHVYVGRNFAEKDDHWVPDIGWFVISYKIDCKYHTYNELWFETDRGFQNMEDKWLTIEPDTDVALAEKWVCKRP